jgi:hypothetical protein
MRCWGFAGVIAVIAGVVRGGPKGIPSGGWGSRLTAVAESFELWPVLVGAAIFAVVVWAAVIRRRTLSRETVGADKAAQGNWHEDPECRQTKPGAPIAS